MSKKSTSAGVGKKVLASALSAAMVVAFAPAVGTAVGSDDAVAYAEGMQYAADTVAVIGGVEYKTLKDALDAAKDGDTVTLTNDTNGDGIMVAKDKFKTGITVDFSGHTYVVGGKLVGSKLTATNAFQLLAGNKITFVNGTILGAEATNGDDGTTLGAPYILIQNYCDLTLDCMTLTGGNQTCYTLSNNCGDTVIRDTIINPGKAQGFSQYKPTAFDVCRFSSYPSVSVTVEGDSQINGRVEVSGTVGEGQNRQLNINGGTFGGSIDVEGNVPANVSVSKGTFSDFSILDYTDSRSDVTVRPQKDLALSKSVSIKNGEKITVDLGEGKAINAASTPFKLLHGKLSFIGEGTVYESEDDQFGAVVVKGSENQSDTDYSVLSVGENVMLRGWSGIFIDQDKGKAYGVKVTLDGKAVNPGMDGHSAAGNGIYLNGQVTDSVNCPVITVGKTAEVTARGDGIYAAGYGKWSISGKVSGSESGMEIRAGELNVNGGEFESTASSFSCDPNGNGSTTVGAALAIAQHTTKKDISIKVADGKFKGLKALNESNPQENDPAPQVTLSVSGGEFDGDVTVVDAQKFITGGKFSTDPTEYVADGYVVSGSGPFTVSKYVAPVTPVDPTPTPTPTPEPAAPGTDVSGTDAAGNTVEATVTDNNKTTLPDGTEAAGSVEFKGTTSGSGSSEAAIPSTITSNGSTYVVTKIADGAFEGQGQLTKVTIPETVVEIGSKAFANTSIASVVIPAATTVIGAGVFQGCDDLKSIDMAGSALTSILDDAFQGCSSLSSISIPETVRSVGARAFKGTALKSVELPAATTTLGTAAFQGCASLKTADISEAALTEIPAYAFNGASITSIDIPDTVKTIGKRAFKKTELKTVSTDAEVLKRGAFSGCASLKSASLPEVTEIGEYAFYDNDALKTLTTGADLEAIGPKAFKGAGKFKVLRISSKRLTKHSVKDSLKGSAVTTVEVAVTGSKKTQDKYVKRYAKFFAKANSGKSVEVTKAKKAGKK